ncbi:hypothetical protein C8F01DRAFT_1134562, partial [Mycena amicta]
MAASTSSTSIVLPSIHEMFPEHLMHIAHPHPRSGSGFPAHHHHRLPAPRVAPKPKPYARPESSHTYSFDVLKSDPLSSSLAHVGSSRPWPPSRAPSRGSSSRSHSPSHSEGTVDEVDSLKDDDETQDVGNEEDKSRVGSSSASARKHVCPTCQKHFNRPSSLRIHVNTHTGATPYRCPHPGCGRAFNVNSNMRRHFRNHLTSSPMTASASISPTSPNSTTSPLSSPSS